MDAFSLALSFGTLGIKRKTQVVISSVVGVFHFFMPIFGTLAGVIFTRTTHLDGDFIESVIFLYIAILMFKDFRSEEREKLDISIIGILIFALGVSLDSFGVGFALNYEISEMFACSCVFAIISASFTLAGLMLGEKLNHLVGKYSILIGAVIMSVLSLINFCQFVF